MAVLSHGSIEIAVGAECSCRTGGRGSCRAVQRIEPYGSAEPRPPIPYSGRAVNAPRPRFASVSAASFSRAIFELCRGSTGISRMNWNCSIPRVTRFVPPSNRSSPTRRSVSSTDGIPSSDLRSIHTIGVAPSPSSKPTNAARLTSACVLNTASTGIVKSVPLAVSTRCAFRPQYQKRRWSSK